MARVIDTSKKLSSDDVTYLRARHPEQYVQRMIELAGGADEAKSTPQEPETAPPAGDGDSPGPGTGDGEKAPESGGGGDEDLIGDQPVFDSLTSTVAEIEAHLKDASDEERKRVLELESSRTDREPRKGVLDLLG